MLQSLSRQNHRAEIIWPEVNQRINYPIKQLLLDMENNEERCKGDETTKFCVSWVAIWAMQGAVKDFVQAWNCHRIPGCEGGIPNVLAAENCHTTLLPPGNIPPTPRLIELHEENGAHLLRDATYGHDPLSSTQQLKVLRQRDFHLVFPNPCLVFKESLCFAPYVVAHTDRMKAV